MARTRADAETDGGVGTEGDLGAGARRMTRKEGRRG
ncbi:hypothetical protein STRAU_0631 [Streptomyces aurantiacus JA 4570]|uniref:Uncharacterized protein n=1 Tax=Streptomyces aurantiacus JA 4570 TaxID=1286094 RepID=S3ZSG6_9ACTN|nr:hypothetical protein STRAU_0631 [Streptomyces aurantiacus JA 4570]